MNAEMTTAGEQSAMSASERVQEMSDSERDALLVRYLEEKEKKVDPYKWQRAYDAKMKGNEEYRKKLNAATMAWQRRKYEEDEGYREKIKARQREYYRKRKIAERSDKEATM